MNMIPLLCFFAATLLAGADAYINNRVLLSIAVAFLALGLFFTALGTV